MFAQINQTIRCARSERGASLVEYALLLAMIAMVCVVAVGFLGGELQDPYSELGSGLRR